MPMKWVLVSPQKNVHAKVELILGIVLQDLEYVAKLSKNQIFKIVVRPKIKLLAKTSLASLKTLESLESLESIE